jgi:hypothetical protein
VASRLYSSTRQLYRQVTARLATLGLSTLGSATLVALIGLYVTGLVLLDVRQTQTRVTRFLPARCHDALNRLLRLMPFSTRAMMGQLAMWVKRMGLSGHLCLDDVVIEKAFACKLPWAGWTYSFAKKRKVYGVHVVVWLWCSTNGQWRIPLAFRVHRPKRSCVPHRYRTKLQLAEQMLKELVAYELPFEYLVFDTHYTAGWFTKMVSRLGYVWIGTLMPQTKVIWRGREQSVSELAQRLHLKWRARLALRAVAVRVYAPTYGHLRLVVTRNRHGNYEYLASNDLDADLTLVVERKRSRWSIETIFRDTKQYAGLTTCQCWVDQAMVRHVSFVLLTFVVLQMMRVHPNESVAAVKERWQLAAIRCQETPPPPLKACSPLFRATA